MQHPLERLTADLNCRGPGTIQNWSLTGTAPILRAAMPLSVDVCD
jgi:hypothetical protein